MTIDRRSLISLTFSLAIMAALVVWYQFQPKPEPDIVNEAGTMQLAGKYNEAIALATQAIEKYLAGSPVGHATEKDAREAAESLRTVIATAKFVSKKSDASEPEKKSKDKGGN